MGNSVKASGGLQGYAVLVTGGGTGIGMACAAQLAADGAAVTISGRRETALADAAERIGLVVGHGGSVAIVVGDVTVEADVQAMVAAALQPTGSLNGCIANAGGGGALGAYDTLDVNEFQRVLNLNVVGTMLCVKICLAHLRAAVVNPDEKVLPNQWRVSGVKKDGTNVSGRLLNEDTYTLQLVDARQGLMSLAKADMASYEVLKESAMPSYQNSIAGKDLEDLSAYLASLR